MVFGRSVLSLMGTCFRFRMMSVASSTTPGIDENSCRTPSIFTAVMAAPSIELSSARRRAFPTVVPQPRSTGCAEKRPSFSVSDTSSDARRFGFWKPFHISFFPFASAARRRGLAADSVIDHPRLLVFGGPWFRRPIGRSATPTWGGRARAPRLPLLRIQFDDQLLVERRGLYVFALGQRHDLGFELLTVLLEP